MKAARIAGPKSGGGGLRDFGRAALAGPMIVQIQALRPCFTFVLLFQPTNPPPIRHRLDIVSTRIRTYSTWFDTNPMLN